MVFGALSLIVFIFHLLVPLTTADLHCALLIHCLWSVSLGWSLRRRSWNSLPAGGQTHTHSNSDGPVWHVLCLMEAEGGGRAGSQRQIRADLEGQVESGQMKEGTV